MIITCDKLGKRIVVNAPKPIQIINNEEIAEALDILVALANGRGGKALRQRAQKLVAKFVEREILK